MLTPAEANLKKLGLTLPPCPSPVASYAPAVTAGNFVYVSGQLPIVEGSLTYRGHLGRSLSVEDGYEAAKLCGLRCISALKAEVGDLDRIERIVKITGYVASATGFTEQPQVINGASDLLELVFGERGKHARAAIGVAELPLGAAVEIEMVAQIN